MRVARLVAVALLLAPGCRYSATDTVQLVKESGVQRLRDDLRPIRGTTRVLVVAFDGVGAGVLEEALEAGHLPPLTTLAGPHRRGPRYEHAYLARDVLSILPSTTMAAWSSVYTGEGPAETGVPGNEWFDRANDAYRAPAPVSVSGHAHASAIYTDGWLGAQIEVPTVFERADVRAHVSLAPVHRGADVLTTPEALDAVQMLSILPAGLVGEHGVSEEAYRALDEDAIDEALTAIDRHGLPDLQVLYFPGVDLLAHSREEPLREQREHLRDVIAPGLQRVLARYRRDKALEHTYVLVISDHGHTPTPHDEAHALSVTDEDADPPAALRAAGFRVRAPQLEVPGGADHSAVVAYQGGMAYVYLADRSTCPDEGDACDWRQPPRFEADVLEAARAFDSSTRDGTPVAGLEGRLEMVLARRPVPLDETPRPFSVFDGDRLVPVDAWLDAHPQPDWVRVSERLRDLAVGPHGHRAGDLLLISRLGRAIPHSDRTYFSGPYHSWHGSPSRQDSEIALMALHMDRSGRELQRLVDDVLGPSRSQLRITPLILRMLAATGAH
ncbi:MAG TPA: alkaline phosphatase family protein [Sandaracinaceae bacterium LLY-WYZ-13_1]|nr:alkaline phosphatase family protein [Sandaracinaceae bacterium LLY-WYZ-13_1]